MKLKEITYRLCVVVLSFVAIVALVACGYNEAELLPDEPTYNISIKLRTNGIFTRAEGPTWGDGYIKEQGTPLDNTINNVDLFLLDENNNVLTRLYALEGEKTDGAAYTYVCTVTEKTPGVTIDKVNRVAKFNKKIKIMAVANVVNQYTPWFDGDWKTNEIPFKVSFGKDDDWYIPMWGINTYENVVIQDKVLEKLDDIDLLRAVSKIVIKLHSDISSDYEIEKVTMANESSLFYAGGYGLPNEALTVEKTTDLKLTGCFNPIQMENIPTMSSPVFKFTSDTHNEVITYVPESSIDADNPFAFNVTLKNINKEYPNRASITGTLYLSNYSKDGAERLEAYTSVVRNHIYEFTVKIKMSTIQFKVDVVPYRSCELEPFFGL